MSNQTLVMIPVYNEAQNIGQVVADIQKHVPEADILVINDGSTDGTLAAAAGLGVVVLDLPYNLGIGGAVQAGLLYARARRYDLVARLDGDGQHDPAQLPLLLETVRTKEADAVIGSRFVAGQGYQASWQRAAGIRLFAWAVSLVTRQRYTDTTSGFQAYNRQASAFLAAHLPADYPEIEGLIMLNRAGFVVREVGVTMRPRQGGKSSITAVRSLYYICKILLAIVIEMLRKPIKQGGL